MLSIIGTGLKLLSWCLGWFSDKAKEKVGATAQALKETASSAKAQAAIAQAEAQAPRTDEGVVERTKNGTF